MGSVVARLSAYVRAWTGGGAALRTAVLDELVAAGVDVVEGGRGLRAGAGAPALALVVRLDDVPTCRDAAAGVVAGDPPRVVGCGAQDLAGLAAFATALSSSPAGRVALIVGEDDDDIDALLPAAVQHVWVAEGSFASGVDADVLDIVAVDPAWLDLSLVDEADDVDRLLVGAAGVVAWSPAPRLPVVVAERIGRLPAAGPFGLFRPDARELAHDPVLRPQVVDSCRLVDFVGMGGAPKAQVRCRALPGRPVETVLGDVVDAVGDPHVRLELDARVDASATSLEAPVARALVRRARAESPRVVVVPALSALPRPSACARLRARGGACIGAVPVLTHPQRRARRGSLDDSVDVAALERAATLTVHVVGDVVEGTPAVR